MSHTTLPPLPYDPRLCRARPPVIIFLPLPRRSRRCSAPSVCRSSMKLFAHIPAPARMIDHPTCLKNWAMRTSIGMLSHRVRKNRLPDMTFLGTACRTTESLTWCRS